MGQPTGAYLRLYGSGGPGPSSDLQLRDDGLNGDAIAGDKVFSAVIPANVFQEYVDYARSLGTGQFRRPFGEGIGYDCNGVGGRAPIDLEIWSPEISQVAVTPVTPDAQYAPNLVNLYNPRLFQDFDPIPVLRRFYQLFPDNYDFLTIVYGPPYSDPLGAYLTHLRNRDQGIGLPSFDRGATYGSANRLLGFATFTRASTFDGAGPMLEHEIAHQWVNWLNVPPLSSGVPHWPLSSMATGLIGWSDGPTSYPFRCKLTQEGGGIRLTMPFEDGNAFYSDWELYLMGMLAPDKVADGIVFNDQSYISCGNQLYTGGVTVVPLSQMIAMFGPRVPDAAHSQKQFRMAIVMVTRDGLLDARTMSFYDYWSRRAEGKEPLVQTDPLGRPSIANPFSVATRGVGSLVTAVKP